VLLYFGMSVVLLGPMDGKLQSNAQLLADYWQETGVQPCTLHRRLSQQPDNIVPYIACFDARGDYLSANALALPLTVFDSPGLAQAALSSQDGTKSDTINGGNGLGSIRRYTLVVRSIDNSQTVLGVVQVGLAVGDLLNALQTLISLLLGVGIVTLGGSALGGLYLTRRAFAPTRLAFARQQAFTTDASHELRTPLTLLRADAEALLRGRKRMDPDDVLLLENIVSETAHMSKLVTNLLMLARLDAGAVSVKHELIDLAALAGLVVRRSQPYAEDRQISLHLEADAQVLVRGDPTLLEQVLLILVDNAIKYNQSDGMVTLRVTQVENLAQVQVSDTGIGIPANDLPRLGERFYRVDKARSREAGGAGLGLAIARSIVANHEGTLDLESTPGQGTLALLRLSCAAKNP
jgi:signal transduction histidine kinase